MNPRSLKSLNAAERSIWLTRQCAMVNWHAHFLPIVRREFDIFREDLPKDQFDKPHWSHLRENEKMGLYPDQENEVWTDRVDISFGVRALPLEAIVRVKNRNRTLSEVEASIAFTQLPNGEVMALLYPPTSEVGRPLQAWYAIGSWRDPWMIQKPELLKCFELLLEAKTFLGSTTYPNPRGKRLMARLVAKDSAFRNGGSQAFVWFRYAYLLFKGIRRLYGLDVPTPSNS
jgi:hypothetical protein